MSAPAFAPPSFEVGQSSPIRSYPVSTGSSVPAGLASLGEPQYMHRYQSFAEQCGLGWLFGSSADKHPTYISYASALVVVTPDAFTVIPWEEITDFLHPVAFRASSGQKYVIGPDFTNYGELYVRFQNEILANFLPKALIAIEEGKEWVFEPFDKPNAGSTFARLLGQPQLTGQLAVSTAGIRYKDQRLAWDDVASVLVTKHMHHGALCRTTISIRKNYSLFATMQFDFSTLPNSFLLTELLPFVCPQRLLVPK